MMQTKGYLNYLTNLLLCAFMSFSFIYALTSSLQLEYGPFRIFIYVLLFLALFSAILNNKRSILLSSAVLFLITALTAVYISSTKSISAFADHFSSYLSWLDKYMIGFEKLNTLYEFYTVIFLSAAISLLIYIFTIKFFNFFLALIGGAALFISQWALGYFVSYLAFYVFLFAIVIYYFRFIHTRKAASELNNYVNASDFTLWVVPVSILIIFSSYILPVSENPLEWKWLSDRVESVINHFSDSSLNALKFEYFSVASSGFGDEGILGGSVNLDKTLVLSVDSPRVTYLKGSARPEYTGYNWLGNNKSFKTMINSNNVLKSDLDEMKTGMWLLSGCDDGYLEKYFYKDSITVTFENLRTKSLFVPVKTESVTYPLSSPPQTMIDDNGSLATKRTSRKGFSYTINNYSAKYGDKDFTEIMRKSSKGIYDELIDNIKKATTFYIAGKDANGSTVLFVQQKFTGSTGYSKINSEDTLDLAVSKLEKEGYKVAAIKDKPLEANVIGDYLDFNTELELKIPNPIYPDRPIAIKSISDLHDLYSSLLTNSINSREVYKKYLQLPDELPERVKELGRAVTATFDNNYDKAKAIEQYFVANSFPYTLSPDKTPRGHDFVDYFLFDLKEGYCTYYASAMTVLLRSAGIPARYVEGYVLPSTTEMGITYKVTNEQAHAWVEVYFEGFGWLPFEPTPPFASALYESTPGSADYSSNFLTDPMMLEYLNRLKMYGQRESSYWDDGEVGTGTVLEDNKPNLDTIFLILVLIIAFLFTLMVFYNFMKKRFMFFKCRRMNPGKGVISLYRHYIKMLSSLDLVIRPGETALQFASRVDTILVFYNFENFKSVTDIFVVARYGNTEVNENDRQSVYNFHEQLKEKARNEMGWFKYFTRSYLLGKL